MARIAKKAPKSKDSSTSSALKGRTINKSKPLSSARTSRVAEAASVLSKDLNAFLHQEKDSKKQKQVEKKKTFLNKLGVSESLPDVGKLAADSYKHTTVTDNTQYRKTTVTTIHDLPGSVSKSTLRRRKKKAQSAVIASVNDLAGALPDFSEENIRDRYKPKVNIPVATSRPLSAKTTQRVVNHEISKFKQTLNNSEFKASPFAALRASISANLVQKPEFTNQKTTDTMEL